MENEYNIACDRHNMAGIEGDSCIFYENTAWGENHAKTI